MFSLTSSVVTAPISNLFLPLVEKKVELNRASDMRDGDGRLFSGENNSSMSDAVIDRAFFSSIKCVRVAFISSRTRSRQTSDCWTFITAVGMQVRGSDKNPSERSHGKEQASWNATWTFPTNKYILTKTQGCRLRSTHSQATSCLRFPRSNDRLFKCGLFLFRKRAFWALFGPKSKF